MDKTYKTASTAVNTGYGVTVRWHFALVAALCAVLGVLLSTHYPLLPWVATLLFGVGCVVFFRWPDSWLIAVPLLLPWIGFAPWTGWITFEELDLLVLATAVGGYARLAWFRTTASVASAHRGRTRHLPVAAVLLALLFAVSIVVAMVRGFADAGGFSFGWFQGYHEAMNSVRLAKSFFLALLVLPLWRAGVARRGPQATTWFVWGLALGLAGASLSTIWERMAFVGLFNFSTDYRTTGLFWEMHVGGAALDGFLTLLLPFIFCELFSVRSNVRWSAIVLCLSIAAYACLTTFSRGVYLAAPLALGVTFALYKFNAQRQLRLGAEAVVTAEHRSNSLSALLLLLFFGGLVFWIFPSSGYRGLLTLLGVLAVAMPLAGVLRRFGAIDWVIGVFAGALFSVLLWVGSSLGSKGTYVGYALVLGGTLAMLFFSRAPTEVLRSKLASVGLAGQLAFAGYLAMLTGMALVADHWGYAKALGATLPVLAGLLLLVVVSGKSPKPLWPARYRWHASTWAGMVVVGGVVSVFGGGAYMGERFSTTGSDFGGRIAHWTEGFGMLSGPLDTLLGKGLGRYPATYYLNGVNSEHPGDYRLKNQDGNNYLVLGGGKQRYMGWGEILRVSQRVRAPQGVPTVTLRVRAQQKNDLHLEICEKHLLYNGACFLAGVTVQPKSGEWQSLSVRLEGKRFDPGSWYAPRLVAFSIATQTSLGLVDVDNIQLTDVDGRELLDNGDFADDLGHWFFSSDRNHLPWHIKNVFMDVLFDQGGVGLMLFCAMFIAALWRVSGGSAKSHPLAPGIGGGLVGFALVGMFDSLIDVPRLAFVFYLVLLLGLTIRPSRSASPPPRFSAQRI